MPAPRGVTISFEKEEIEWLHWALNDVFGAVLNQPTIKEKVDKARELLHAAEPNNGSDKKEEIKNVATSSAPKTLP